MKTAVDLPPSTLRAIELDRKLAKIEGLLYGDGSGDEDIRDIVTEIREQLVEQEPSASDESDVNPWDVLRELGRELMALSDGLRADQSGVAANWSERLLLRVKTALEDKKAARSIFVGGERYEAPDKALELMPVIDGLARQIVRAVPRNDLTTEDRERLITGLAEDIREQAAKVMVEGGL